MRQTQQMLLRTLILLIGLCTQPLWAQPQAASPSEEQVAMQPPPPVSGLSIGQQIGNTEAEAQQAAAEGEGSAWHKRGALPALLLLSVVAMVSISRRKNHPH